MRARPQKIFASLAAALFIPALALSQAGRRPAAVASVERSATLNVTVSRADGSSAPVTAKELALYDGGIEQTIQGFTQDPTPARILILVDNSLSLRADVEKLTQATREFAYEIYDGDKVMIVGYDESAEVIVGWTDDAKEIEKSLTLFRKQGDPHLFDALHDVMSAELQPLGVSARKRAVVLVADGLDRGSKTKFPDLLAELQKQDVTVYALQIPDRTGGALRRDRPKPNQVIQQLVDGTGGQILSVEQPGEAAKTICDELRKNRYVLSYTPASVSYYDNRRLLLVGPEGLQVRAKAQQPAQIVIR